MTDEIKKTLSVEEVAQALHVGVNHVNRLCRQGKIKAVKPFGRWLIDKADFLTKNQLQEVSVGEQVNDNARDLEI